MYSDSAWETAYTPSRRGARFGILAFLLVSLVACVSAALVIPGGLGLLVGYQELQTQNHEAAIIHFNRGLGYQAENYPELARSEFEIALRYDNTFEPAQQKLRELQSTGNGATGTPAEDRVAATLYNEARNLVAQKEWDDAITRLEQLRTLKSDYRAAEVNDLLFQAYWGGGKAAVAAGQIELARGRFESALTIRNDSEVLRQRDLAVLYLDGQQAAGYNWQIAIQKFAALYQQDPHYDDVGKRLFDAHRQYGDLAAKQGSPCLAVREYDGALAITNEPTLAQKRAQAMTLCKQAISATPTPASALGVENYTWKISLGNDKPCNGLGDVTGFVRDALGRLLTGVPVGYYADGISLVATKTNGNGQYQFVLGQDPGLVHVVILGADGKTPSSLAADVEYPGGNKPGCHVVVDWQKVQ
jgi:tetratricopeptide (TPR) repeat protein